MRRASVKILMRCIFLKDFYGEFVGTVAHGFHYSENAASARVHFLHATV